MHLLRPYVVHDRDPHARLKIERVIDSALAALAAAQEQEKLDVNKRLRQPVINICLDIRAALLGPRAEDPDETCAG